MHRNQRTYIFDLSGMKGIVDYHFGKRGVLVFDTDINNIILEVVDCCLGNATRDNLARCQRNIFAKVNYIVDNITVGEIYEIILILCNELEATYLHTMRMEADQEPSAFCFTFDARLCRLAVQSESLPLQNGWVDQRAYSYEMQLQLNGEHHERVHPYATGSDFCWRAV